MALRKPLVINAGQVQQLQSGDTLDAPQAGGDQVVLTNDEASPVVIGAPIYIDAVDGFKKAQANASGTKDVKGLVAKSPSITNATSGAVQTSGVLVATTTQWDAVTGQSGGLTFNTRYYLDPSTSGKLTITGPTTVGQYVAEVGLAISTTELDISIKSPVLL